MKTIGIIAEFNPLHNGHQYLIAEAKRLLSVDFCVVIMSGNFVQRGAPALMDKYSRTRMTLLNGADLVIELPVVYATASAEYFARGAVRLLDKLGIIDHLCFGSECGNLASLKRAADLLSHESALFQEELKSNLKKGMSYPQARSQSIDSFSQFGCEEAISSDLTHLINQPNNILGIEYLKALRFFDSKISPATIKRQGSGYHDEQAQKGEFCSATAVRKMLLEGSAIGSFVPKNTLELYARHENHPLDTVCVPENEFSELLHYKLTLEADSGYTQFFDVSSDLSDKIRKNLKHFTDCESFIHALKSKDLTYMRISRCLCHILLDIFETDITYYKERDYIFYARMLGFREKSGELLHEIKKHSMVPLLSKVADANRLLDEAGMRMLRKDIQAAHIYNRKMNEYTVPIVKI